MSSAKRTNSGLMIIANLLWQAARVSTGGMYAPLVGHRETTPRFGGSEVATGTVIECGHSDYGRGQIYSEDYAPTDLGEGTPLPAGQGRRLLSRLCRWAMVGSPMHHSAFQRRRQCFR